MALPLSHTFQQIAIALHITKTLNVFLPTHTYCSVCEPAQHPQHKASGDLANCEPGLPLLHRHCGNPAEGNHTPTKAVL